MSILGVPSAAEAVCAEHPHSTNPLCCADFKTLLNAIVRKKKKVFNDSKLRQHLDIM